LPFVVSLFSGAGGLDWGFAHQDFPIALAIDHSDAAVRTHKRNLPNTNSVCADLAELGAAGVATRLKTCIPAGSSIGVIGGPPCQGFSRANIGSTKNDPRNKLVPLYLEIVRELTRNFIVKFIVFENVLGIKDEKHAETFGGLLSGLRTLGFAVEENEFCALDFGVPQARKRVIVSGFRSVDMLTSLRPRRRKGTATVREAIGSLRAPAFFSSKLKPEDIPVHPNHWTMNPRSPKFNQSPETWKSGRSFRRTFWDKPSPTIAFGHREINVHPDCERRLSIYEAMLLQGFPENYVIEGNLSEQSEQVSNAVPPPLASSIASAVKRTLRGSSR
jgi:DNA (cytosine-5)-methyltransferase 1